MSDLQSSTEMQVRDFTKKKQRLLQEFRKVDKNSDDLVSRDELLQFLDTKSKDSLFNRDIADQIFSHADINDDNTLTIDEFVNTYISAEQQLKVKLNEETRKLRACQEAIQDLRNYLHHAPAISAGDEEGSQGFLMVDISEIKELQIDQYQGVEEFVLVLHFGQKEDVTARWPLNNEVKIEDKQFIFTMEDRHERLSIELVLLTVDNKRLSVGSALVDVSNLLDKQPQRRWVDLKGVGDLAQIQLDLHYIRRKDDFYRFRVHQLQQDKEVIEETIQQYKEYLRDLMDPFVFLNVAHHSRQRTKVAQNLMMGIDIVADQLAHRLGVAQLPWYKSSYYGMIIYGALTALVLFHRPDFINLSVAAAGILVLASSYVKNAAVIFNIVIGLIVGQAFDFIWFCTVGIDQWGDIKQDGGLEKSIRQFSIVMSVISFFFKVGIILMAIVWKFSETAVSSRSQASGSEMRESNASVQSAQNPFES